MKALCCKKLNNENRIKLSEFFARDERVCLICLINIREVFCDVIVALLIFKLFKIANNSKFKISNSLRDQYLRFEMYL